MHTHTTLYNYAVIWITLSFFPEGNVCIFFRLLNKTSPLLKLIGKKFPFESTVGLNGRVWINAKSTNHMIVIANAIVNSEYMTDGQIETMVKQLADGLRG